MFKIGDRVRQVIDEPNTYIIGTEGTIVDIVEVKNPSEDRFLPSYLVEYTIWNTGEVVRHLWPLWWKLEIIND